MACRHLLRNLRSYDDFRQSTKRQQADLRRWCADKARTANRERRMSDRPEHQISPDGVLRVLEAAQGRCYFCNSLAVEKHPPGPWNRVGRRIGTLRHLRVKSSVPRWRKHA
jgi:hypothetical protein